MSYLSNKIFLAGSFLILLTCFVLTEEMFSFLTELRFRVYERAIIEPVGYFAIGLFVSSAFLLLGSAETYRKWQRNIFLWYAPLSLLVIASGSTGSTYGWISRGDFAALLGTGLVVITVVFMLLQRFYYKHP